MSKTLRRAPHGTTGLRSGRHRLAIIGQRGPEPDARRLARPAGEATRRTAPSPDLTGDQMRRGNLTGSTAGPRRLTTRQHRDQTLTRGRWITVPAAYRKQTSHA